MGSVAIMSEDCGLYPPALFESTIYPIRIVSMAEIGRIMQKPGETSDASEL